MERILIKIDKPINKETEKSFVFLINRKFFIVPKSLSVVVSSSYSQSIIDFKPMKPEPDLYILDLPLWLFRKYFKSVPSSIKIIGTPKTFYEK